MPSIRIGIVNYLNALPYMWAFEQLSKEGLHLNIEEINPSAMVDKYHDGEYDLCLLSVCGIHISKAHQLSKNPFGIACDGAVLSVGLFSNQPIGEIQSIYMDTESRTSNALMHHLGHHFLGKECEFLMQPIHPKKLLKNQALVAIGNKALAYRKQFKHVYDLGELWKQYTKLPFVFARWVSGNYLKPEIEEKINQQFRLTVANLQITLKHNQQLNVLAKTYLGKHIKYTITEKMEEGMQSFLKLNQEFSN